MRIELLSDDLAVLGRWEKALAEYAPKEAETLSAGSEAIVLVDLDTRAKTLLDFLKNEGAAGAKIVALEGAPDVERAKRWLAAGVRGYGNTYMLPVHLQSCVQTVAEGKIWVYPDFVHAMVGSIFSRNENPAPSLPSDLTERERQIVERLMEGKSNREIAEALGITERTVKAHLGSVYRKMRVSNRLELATRLSA